MVVWLVGDYVALNYQNTLNYGRGTGAAGGDAPGKTNDY